MKKKPIKQKKSSPQKSSEVKKISPPLPKLNSEAVGRKIYQYVINNEFRN
ncbi:MAG: hypothetical protein IJ728_11580 [Selenomonadaceae bacterium]|nr:hypothetical protein [Selenomonadaceae bacterium]